MAKQLIASEESQYQEIEATTDSNVVILGQTLTLAKHNNAAFQGDYNVLGLKHKIDLTSDATQNTYQCQVNCRNTKISPSPRFPKKPKAPGLMTAVVVTDSGTSDSKGDLNQDKDAQVRVHFHWDVSDAKSASCLLRVAQMMAGSQAGMQFIRVLAMKFWLTLLMVISTNLLLLAVSTTATIRLCTIKKTRRNQAFKQALLKIPVTIVL